MSAVRLGILGTGVYLPPTVLKNDWWAPEVVAGWTRKTFLKSDVGQRPTPAPEEHLTEGWRLALAAQRAHKDDPFMGTKERRVLDATVPASEIEALAARDALAAAGVAVAEVDVLITQSTTPDYLCNPNACGVHQRLGLRTSCLSFSIDPSMCSGFVHQLAIAEGLVVSGRARRVLLVQSSTVSRVTPRSDQESAWFGDGAAAVVVGAASDGSGVLGLAHQTHGFNAGSVVCGVKGRQWWEDGAIVAHVTDRAKAREMLLSSVDWAREVFEAALGQAGVERKEIGFYAAHQMPCWFRAVTQSHLGLDHAKASDTYPWAGTIAGANLPLALHLARKERLVGGGDTVALVAVGAGATAGAVVARLGAS